MSELPESTEAPEVSSATPAPESVEPSSPTPVSAGLRESLATHFPEFANLQSDDEVVSQLNYLRQSQQQFQQQLPQIRQAMAVYQQAAPHWDKFQEYLKSQQAPPAAAEPPKPKYQPPEFNPKWLQMVEEQNGRLVPLPGADPNLGQKIAEYQDFVREQSQKFWRSPVEFLNEVGYGESLQQQIEQRVQEALEQRLSSFEKKQQIAQLINQNMGMFVQMQDNQPVYDALGQPQFTPEGQAFYRYVEEADSLGISDPEKRWQYAMKQLRADVADQLIAQQQQQAPITSAIAAQVNEQKKQEFTGTRRVSQAARQPSRAGTIARAADPSAPSQNPNASLREAMRAELVTRGLAR